MLRRLWSAVLIAGLTVPVCPALARAGTWEIDPAHTSVQFSVRHLMINDVHGEFTKVAGTIAGDQAKPTAARIDVSIDAASIDTRNAKRDEHLRSADFLDVSTYPSIYFHSTKIEPAGAGKWRVTGGLTLHGVTRDVVLEVTTAAAPIKDPSGKMRAGGHVQTAINRQDFGISFNKSLDGGGVLVGNEIAITIDVEAIENPPQETPHG